MNTALQHVGAKPKDGDGKKKKQKLPKAAALFAKQMGLDLTGLEAEADDIWSMLNNMSEDNPMQYESFVQEQMENKARAEKLEPEGESAKYFRPTAGFCIRTQTTGGDGIKVRERGQGKKLFVNICSHVALEPPRDQSGKPAMDERLSADGLQFPLLIGPTRDCQDSDGADAIAIDVIFHPAVIHHCLLQSQFKSQIVSLALQWVKQDATVEFDEYMWQPLKSPEYMGGRGVDDSTPVLMSVEYAIQQSAGPKERSDTYLSGETVADKLPAGRNQALTDSSLTRSSAALATPQNLLRFSELDKSEQNEIANEVRGVPLKTLLSLYLYLSLLQNIKLSTSAAPAKKPLVQVVCAEGGAPRVEQLDEPEPEILASASAAFGPKQKPQKVIKKGFLNDLSSKGKASNIYPEKGSAEGEGGAKGGTYQRFMSKCQVIDTSKVGLINKFWNSVHRYLNRFHS